MNIFIIKWKVYEIMNMLLAWFNDFMTYIGQNYIPYAQFYLLKKIGNKNNNILNMKSLWTKLTKKEKRKNRKLRVVTILEILEVWATGPSEHTWCFAAETKAKRPPVDLGLTSPLLHSSFPNRLTPSQVPCLGYLLSPCSWCYFSTELQQKKLNGS